ncbi:bifunctional serine/threonine-protein kinase/phosphatase [Ancylobacter moscoviensis]
MALPYLMEPPPAAGRVLPNGMTVATDETRPTLFFKLTPWKNAALAFNELDIYARMPPLDEASGVVRLLGVGGTSGHLVRAMERSRPGALDRLLFDKARGDSGAMDVELVRTLLAPIAEAMAGLHAMNLVHRDLKAENILMFGEAGGSDIRSLQPKISDFDRAVELGPGCSLEKPVGSPFHMAPELLAWKPHDRKVDIYAFGILMFEVAHGGARPHLNVGTAMPGSLSRAEFAGKVVDEELRPQWRHMDDSLRRLAFRCWASDPDERPDFEEIARLLAPPRPRATSPGRPGGEPCRDVPRTFADVGLASHIGKARSAMEDAVAVIETPDVLVAGLFDGFRGGHVSEFCARQLPMTLIAEMAATGEDAWSAMHAAFAAVEARLDATDVAAACGSTAVAALLREDDLTIAWLGDSPAYLLRKRPEGTDAVVIPLVDGHRPERADEAMRVMNAGGVVERERRWLDNGEAVPWGPLRVFAGSRAAHGAGLAVSRAFGATAFKPAIGSEPEVLRLERREDDLFLMLASDGVPDVLDAEAASRLILSAGSAQEAADAVISAVLQNGAPDNAGVVVVDLRRSAPRGRRLPDCRTTPSAG